MSSIPTGTCVTGSSEMNCSLRSSRHSAARHSITPKSESANSFGR